MSIEPDDATVDRLVAANPNGMTAEAIAEVLGVTRQRCFQIIDKAIAKVQRELRWRQIYGIRDVM